jgi:hypothetical protein
MGSFRSFLLWGLLLSLSLGRGLWSQEHEPNPAALIGLTLGELLSRYGTPESVYAVRGAQEWQDDVVFVYRDMDCYLYKDRVWQISLQAAFGLSIGDRRELIPLVFEEGVRDFDTYTLLPISGQAWPLQLRLNMDRSGKITRIFLYRSDF